MAQIVRIECSDCEAVDEYEMDGCVLIGWRKGGLFLRQHELKLGKIIDDLISEIVKENEEKLGKEEIQ